MALEGLELRAEDKAGSHPAVVQRLFSQTITGQRQLSLRAAPQGKCEHACGDLQGLFDTPCAETGQEGFRIAMALPCRRFCLDCEFLAQIQVVVDLAIEGDDEIPV